MATPIASGIPTTTGRATGTGTSSTKAATIIITTPAIPPRVALVAVP